ncbi:MAG: hypothetical protein R6U61_02985 [Thermoplasmata archaeon]
MKGNKKEREFLEISRNVYSCARRKSRAFPVEKHQEAPGESGDHNTERDRDIAPGSRDSGFLGHFRSLDGDQHFHAVPVAYRS